MTPAKLNIVVSAAISIEKQIADLEKQRARFKTELIAEAASRPEEHQPTEGGGKSWAAKNSNGDIVRVTFPGRALKSSISGEGKAIEKIRAAADDIANSLGRLGILVEVLKLSSRIAKKSGSPITDEHVFKSIAMRRQMMGDYNQPK